MASRYHPLYGGLWSSPHLEGLPFEAKAFFAYLCSNDHLRPSGIYRASDAQLAADTGLPAPRVRFYLATLVARGRIVRDGAWLFVRGYLERQPKQERLLQGVKTDVAECNSPAVLKSFSLKYPQYDRWSSDRLATIDNPMNAYVPTEQLQMQSNYRNYTVGLTPDDASRHDNGSDPTPTALRLLAFLNRKAAKHFQPVAVNLGLIAARLREGATEAQCRAIIGRHAAAWGPDPKMARYLRPATLFNREKFAQYLGELPASAFEEPSHD